MRPVSDDVKYQRLIRIDGVDLLLTVQTYNTWKVPRSEVFLAPLDNMGADNPPEVMAAVRSAAAEAVACIKQRDHQAGRTTEELTEAVESKRDPGRIYLYPQPHGGVSPIVEDLERTFGGRFSDQIDPTMTAPLYGTACYKERLIDATTLSWHADTALKLIPGISQADAVRAIQYLVRMTYGVELPPPVPSLETPPRQR